MPLCNWQNATAALLCTSTALLLLLTVLGPPPPIATETYRPRPSTSPKFILGNASYAAFDEAANRLWDAVVPDTGGSVLATNMTTGLHFWARLAMFHQLSCLRDVRAQFARMTQSGDESIRFRENKGAGSLYDELGQCFDYLLQVCRNPQEGPWGDKKDGEGDADRMNATLKGVLCHADTTLHPVATLKGGVKIVDGNALWHMCRDSSVLTDWAVLSGIPHKVSGLLGPHDMGPSN